MAYARAIALPLHPFAAAAHSFHNSISLILDRMYGTPERVNTTLAFAVMMAIVGMLLGNASQPLLLGCAAG